MDYFFITCKHIYTVVLFNLSSCWVFFLEGHFKSLTGIVQQISLKLCVMHILR